MSDATTIKVSKDLRDRLAVRARHDHLTLAEVIGRALDESEERQFWSAVTKEHAVLSAADHRAYAFDATLADAHDPVDDAVSLRQEW